MHATETPLVKFLEGTRQFVIPIYQRTYSWTEKQCEQLCNDIVRVSQDEAIPGHFIGSIVYIEKGLYHVSDVTQLLVIDGQQRLTTLSLLLMAIGKALEENGNSQEVSKNKIYNNFLFNSQQTGEERYKLILTKSDKETFINLLEGKKQSENVSKNIYDNYKFYQTKISKTDADLDLIYHGIRKLLIVDISLDSNHDNPQLIFESLNSTGLELSQADLIRNYVLIGLSIEKQEEIYNNFWYPMEERFGHSKGVDYFDRFMRDYLTIKTGQIPNIRDVYSGFKEYFASQKKSLDVISDIYYFSEFYTKIVFEKEDDPQLNNIIQDINTLRVDTAYPFLLEVLVDFDKGKLSKKDLLEIFLLVESYVFRRVICDIPANSLNKTFGNLADEKDENKYLESIKVAFNRKQTYRRFPTDSEFKAQFVFKNVYNSKIRKYLFDKLENFGKKELVDVEKYTLEHIMPQNKNLSENWRINLGNNWMAIQDKYLHTVGNLTLTGYNPELSDKSFSEKRDMEGGFKDSPIRLNHGIAKLDSWNENEILKRANSIIDQALIIWKYPDLPEGILEKYPMVEEDVEEEFEEDELHQQSWDQRFAEASDEIRQTILSFTEAMSERFDYIAEPHRKYLYFYVAKPMERKTLFALLNCGKNSANVIFRVDPESFKGSRMVRMVAGWFFPRGTERRISIRDEGIPRILDYMEHAYATTNALNKKHSY